MRIAGRKIKVGPFTFSVRRSKMKDSECGTCDIPKQVINISHWVRNPEMMRATLLHESLHAILETHQQFATSENEPLMECLTNGLIQLLRDNPWLAELITEGTRDE